MIHSLYKNDLVPMLSLSDFQKESINNLLNDINNNILILENNHCLCSNKNAEKDIVISEKDRYGIPVKQLICSKCGLIRNQKIFNVESNIKFYKNYYRNIYVGLKNPNDQFFEEQKTRGEKFLTLVKSHVELKKIQNILEIGCGSGGILAPFHEINISCTGVDYNKEYLEYGRLKGLSLICGDYKSHIEDDSVDLLILSHVMEHFTNPINEMIEVINKVKTNKYLLVEVPGIFFMNKVYLNPILYLQNAHVFNFYYSYLKVFFEKLGLEVIYGDERCTFLLHKCEGWKKPEVKMIYEKSLSDYPEKINVFIRKTNFLYKYSLSPYVWKSRLVNILDFFGIKETIKHILGKRR